MSNEGHTCVLSVIDHFSGFAFAKPLKNQSAYATSKVLAKIFLNFGIPNAVLSDNGPIFHIKSNQGFNVFSSNK